MVCFKLLGDATDLTGGGAQVVTSDRAAGNTAAFPAQHACRLLPAAPQVSEQAPGSYQAWGLLA